MVIRFGLMMMALTSGQSTKKLIITQIQHIQMMLTIQINSMDFHVAQTSQLRRM